LFIILLTNFHCTLTVDHDVEFLVCLFTCVLTSLLSEQDSYKENLKNRRFWPCSGYSA